MKYKGIKKLYYSISEISALLGVKQSVIRYWESEFKELKPQKNRAGNRIYKKDDIAILRLIHHYVHERHLSIHEANEVINDLKADGLYKRKLQEVNSVDFKPVEKVEKEVEEVEEVDKVDKVEEVEEAEETEETPVIEIETPQQETVIYPFEEKKEEIESEKEEIVETQESIEVLPEPEPSPEPVQQSDPELKELLKKISGNIKDIIDILNE